MNEVREQRESEVWSPPQTDAAAILVGVDTGGTFTDLVLIKDGSLRVAKVPSTPPAFDRGVLSAVAAADLDPGRIDVFTHGTTATTNALITKSGTRALLVTTNGFRDVLELRRHNREEPYDIAWDPPKALIPRRDRLEVHERIAYSGEVMVPLSRADAIDAARIIKKRGAEAVAVVFLNSFANPSHEEEMRDVLQQELPEAYITISSDLVREPHEFERTATTVANAYLGPIFRRYIAALRAGLRTRGYKKSLMVMHSGGGLLPAASMDRVPARTVLSGPAAGVLAAASIGKMSDRLDLISLDMGGTSADIGLVRGGEVHRTSACEPEFGLPVRFPSIDIVTVGAGGGSIAWIDRAGYPKVGPQSAGATPGPASYGLGGEDATVTDANLVLGRLSEDSPLAGSLTLDMSLAVDAVQSFASALGLTAEEAAAGIIRIANSNMARGVRLMTVERGLDPRAFALFAFGGAGPLHAIELAEELAVPEVIIPAYPGVTSALGLLFADVVHDFSLAMVCDEKDISFPNLKRELLALEEQGRRALLEDGWPARFHQYSWMLDLRYSGQIKAVTLAIAPDELAAERFVHVRRRFFESYERRFHYVTQDIPLELAVLRVSARVRTSHPRLEHVPALERAAAPYKRQVYFDQAWTETTVLDRATLLPAQEFDGPVIIEQFDTTIAIPPGCRARTDSKGTLRVDLSERLSSEGDTKSSKASQGAERNLL